MKTALAMSDGPRDYICPARADGPGHRCWKRDGHDGQHMAAVPPWEGVTVRWWVDRW